MNGQLAKEQRRNLRKEMGAAAVDAVERCTTTVRTLTVQHAALAKELIEVRGAGEASSKALTERANALGAWCQKLEAQLEAHKRQQAKADAGMSSDVDRMFHDFSDEVTRREQLEQLTFLERLGWLMFGILPEDPNWARRPHHDDNEAHLS